jgi:hypothetical protein
MNSLPKVFDGSGLDDIYNELTSIDLKLGVAPGAMGLDDIYNELVVIGSIESSTSSIDHNTAMLDINTAG